MESINITQDRRGFLGLDTVKAVMIILLTLAVVAIAVFLALNSISSNAIISQTQTITGTPFANSTVTLNNTVLNIPAVSTFRSPVLTNVIVVNATGQQLVGATNYTVSAGTITLGAGASAWNGSSVNVSASFTYSGDSNSVMLVNNVTYGTTNFFSNIPTVFIVLGAVVIIFAVSLILYAVSRFAGGGSNISEQPSSL